MAPDLIDTHCHLNLEPLAADVEAVLDRARAAGVRACISIGTTLEASRANVELARRHPMVRAAVGIHPNDSDGATPAALAAIEALAADPRVAAIGEVGLDYYRDHVEGAVQRAAFGALVAMAQRRRLPLLIHCRQAYDDLIAMLVASPAAGDTSSPAGIVPARSRLIGVIHCASGPPEFIQAALALGLHVSFAGNVTFPNAQPLRELVGLVPDERLLLETDAPFLAPQAVRGRPNEPAYVAHTAAYVAQLRGTTVEALGALTAGNARRLFHLGDI